MYESILCISFNVMEQISNLGVFHHKSVKPQNMEKIIKIALTNALLEAQNMARKHSFTQPDDQLTCLWEQERFVWTPERTRQMRKILKALFVADEIDYFVSPTTRCCPTLIRFRKQTRESGGHSETDYELWVGKKLVELSSSCYSP